MEAQLITAHRGASFDAPENTLAAFRLAWRQGADAIEGDFRLSKDGKVVCVHDADLHRLAGAPDRVADLTSAEIRQHDVGAWKHARFSGEKIPTLEQVLETMPPGKRAFLELKTGPEIVTPLKQTLPSCKIDPGCVVLIAFDTRAVVECKRQLPEVRCHWLTGFEQNNGAWTPTAGSIQRTLAETGADGVGFQANREALTPEFVNATGAQEFHVWTIDDPEDACYFRGLGAWGITTNRPGWLREQLRE